MSFGASFNPNSFKISLFSLLMFVLFGSVIVNVFLNKNIDLEEDAEAAEGAEGVLEAAEATEGVLEAAEVAGSEGVVAEGVITEDVLEGAEGAEDVTREGAEGVTREGAGNETYEFLSNPYFFFNSASFSALSDCNLFEIAFFNSVSFL